MLLADSAPASSEMRIFGHSCARLFLLLFIFAYPRVINRQVPDIAVRPFLGKDSAERKAAVEASV
jgi:hypothetical protein